MAPCGQRRLLYSEEWEMVTVGVASKGHASAPLTIQYYSYPRCGQPNCSRNNGRFDRSWQSRSGTLSQLQSASAQCMLSPTTDRSLIHRVSGVNASPLCVPIREWLRVSVTFVRDQ